MSWNGMMIDGMAKAYLVIGDARYLDAAIGAARFILDKMRAPTLQHTYKDGIARLGAYLDDYAAMANALVTLYECDFNLQWLVEAKALADTMLDEFWDKENDAFFYTAKNHEALITRPKDVQDGATPSGAALAVTALSRLGRLLGNTLYGQRVERALLANEPNMRHSPGATGQWLVAAAAVLDRPEEIAVMPGESAEDFENALQLVRQRFAPSAVVAGAGSETAAKRESVIPWLKGKKAVNDQVTVYVCEGYACREPLVGLATITKAFAGEEAT